MEYIKDLSKYTGREVTLKGWVSNKRTGKGLVFIVLRDGSGFCQCVITEGQVSNESFEDAKRIAMESAIEVSGNVVKDEKQIGGYEVQATNFKIISEAEEYPVAKKEHGVDFLMDNRHLWLRTMRQWAIMRVRNRLKVAINTFFQENDFMQMDAPIFTGNACEGTSTLFETDFFGETAYLSQSGQLYGEALAMALGKIYTFGPTFRAEKSKTRRHLSEFWMIEPEMAFYDLEMNMNLIEEFLKYVVNDILQHCEYELKILERDTTILKNVNKKFPRISYDQAVRIIKGEEEVGGKNAVKELEKDLEELKQQISDKQKEIKDREDKIASGSMKKGEINFNRNRIDVIKNEIKDLEERANNIPQWLQSAKNFEHGNDFGGSDETVLTRLFDVPVMVYNWPKEVKAFYMKRVEEDDRYVKGVDVLAPEGFGEIIGGAERENNKDLLVQRIKEHALPMEAFEWYIDLRRFGSVPHAGFGLGLERLVAWVCNLHHVRETIPFPRMYGRLFP